MVDKAVVEVLAFTDPVCTWCWGSEPMLRKLEAWYDDGVHLRYVMGGLVKDITEFYDAANAIGGDPERSNAQIARHWLEASERHHMPVRTDGFRLFSADTVSTYPQNIAFKAAELTDASLAARFLRRMREASAAEARETGRREVLMELASDVGLDVATFVDHLDDGSAERAFRDDLQMTARYGVRGFPTFVFRYGGREMMLRGYQSFRAMQAAIAALAGDSLQAQPPAKGSRELVAFLKKYRRAAPIELMTVFELTSEELDALIADAGDDVRQVTAGNGVFFEVASPALGTCDPQTGVCSL